MKSTVRNLLLVATIALGLHAANACAEEIKVGGGGAAMSTVFHPVGPAFQRSLGINLISLQSTPKEGLIDLVKGKLDAAVAAVTVDNMIAGAAKDGVTVDKAKLQVTEVGTNRTVLFVNPENKVAKLTRAQVKGIFSGSITNWKEVGGDDKEIAVVWGTGTPGQNAQFTKEVMDGAAVTKNAMVLAGNYQNLKEIVANTPEAICIDPFGLSDSSVKVIENDPAITSPIILVTLGNPSAKVKKLIDYVKGEGKQFTKQ